MGRRTGTPPFQWGVGNVVRGREAMCGIGNQQEGRCHCEIADKCCEGCAEAPKVIFWFPICHLGPLGSPCVASRVGLQPRDRLLSMTSEQVFLTWWECHVYACHKCGTECWTTPAFPTFAEWVGHLLDYPASKMDHDDPCLLVFTSLCRFLLHWRGHCKMMACDLRG